MDDQQTISHLQDRIAELEEEQNRLRETVAQAQLEQWEGRLDEFDLQLHLGEMEMRDKLEPLLQGVREQLADARSRVASGATTASDATAALRGGLEEAWKDLRTAIEQAKAIVTG